MPDAENPFTQSSRVQIDGAGCSPVAELVEMSGRSQPNLTRTLAKMGSAGFITMKAVGRRKAPTVAVKKIVVEIDPYSDRDLLNGA